MVEEAATTKTPSQPASFKQLDKKAVLSSPLRPLDLTKQLGA
ncbi:hypothetical protein [Candidatus Darwinibacter acetoxidans]